MNTRFIAAFIAILCSVSVPSVYAATFLSHEDVASVRSELNGDLYTASNSVVVTAPVQGDIFAAGDSIDISGTSSGSIFAAGRSISLTGSVTDDIRAAGRNISIGSDIRHDLFAAGSSVIVTHDSTVEGDVYLAGETMIVSGTVKGTIRTAGNKLTITKDAAIEGDVIVRGNEPVIEDGATISGTVRTISTPIDRNREEGRRTFFVGILSSMVSSAILGLVLVFAAPKLKVASMEYITKRTFQSALLGLAWLVLCIPVTVILFISGIGAWIGILLLFATLPLSILAFGSMTVATGQLLLERAAKRPPLSMWQYPIIGAVIITLVGLLGAFGFLAVALAFFIALGATILSIWDMLQGN